MSAAELWWFLLFGYVATVAIELPILLLGLSKQTKVADRIKLGFILSAITYPIVVLVLPVLVAVPFGQLAYLGVAETFAPVAEIAAFRVFMKRPLLSGLDREALVILVANLASFLIGYAFLGRWIQQAIHG